MIDGHNGLLYSYSWLNNFFFFYSLEKRGGEQWCQLILLCFINKINLWFLENYLISSAESCKYLPKIFVDRNFLIWALIKQIKKTESWTHPVFLKIQKKSCHSFMTVGKLWIYHSATESARKYPQETEMAFVVLVMVLLIIWLSLEATHISLFYPVCPA